MSPITVTAERLWHGQYSLAASVIFLIVGTFVAQFIGLLGGLLFVLIGVPLAGKLVFQLIFWGYITVAAVGVWRSANALISIPSWHGLTKSVGSIKIIAAKLFVCVWIVAMLGAVGFKPEHVLRLFQ